MKITKVDELKKYIIKSWDENQNNLLEFLDMMSRDLINILHVEPNKKKGIDFFIIDNKKLKHVGTGNFY